MTTTLYRRPLLALLAGLLSCATVREVDASCGSNADCDDGDFCRRGMGNCGGEGTCEMIMDVCIQEYDPVCGCDGRTYSNACLAEAEGVSVARKGKDCGGGSGGGGGLVSSGGAPVSGGGGLVATGGADAPGCASDDACEGYCQFQTGSCGFGDAVGKCDAMPEDCTMELNPVCGCDGSTYGNACAARSVGVSVASEGECPIDCAADEDCDEDWFCQFKDGVCGFGGAVGRCNEVPEACGAEPAPVCGCDDVTYGNACLARAGGVSVARPGECDGAGDDAAEGAGAATATEEAEEAGADPETPATGDVADADAAVATTVPAETTTETVATSVPAETTTETIASSAPAETTAETIATSAPVETTTETIATSAPTETADDTNSTPSGTVNKAVDLDPDTASSGRLAAPLLSSLGATLALVLGFVH